MDDSGLTRRLESLSPPNLSDARERAKLAARVSLSQGDTPAAKGRRVRFNRPSRHPRRSLRLTFLVAGAAVAAFLAIGGPGGPGGSPAPALGGDLRRLVEASPPILLDAPGWRVEGADESFKAEGSTQFFRGRQPQSAVFGEGRVEVAFEHFAELTWFSASLTGQIRRATTGAIEVTTAPALATTAHVYVYPYRGPRRFVEAIALWEHGDRVLVFRSFVPNIATFKQRLTSLRSVGATAWAGALHGTVIRNENGVAVVPPSSDGQR